MHVLHLFINHFLYSCLLQATVCVVESILHPKYCSTNLRTKTIRYDCVPATIQDGNRYWLEFFFYDWSATEWYYVLLNYLVDFDIAQW